MSNNEATQCIENLKKTYEKKYNMDTSFLWIFNYNLEIANSHNENIKNGKNIEFIYYDKCEEIIGKKEETNNIVFNKLFLNLIYFELNIDNNKDNIVKIDYLHVLLTDSIQKGKKYLIFLDIKNKL